jgi:Uma2 family endonuclease
MALIHEPITQQVVLHDISWSTYQAMLRDLGDERSARLTYDRGVLEITMPSDEHESYKHLLERIITTLTLEFGLRVKGFASTTLSREDLQQSVEPDACYYIQNADKVQGRRIDLASDPPPDLVVEVDVTNPSQRKFALYAQLGVGELWVCVNRRVSMYGLQAGAYLPREYSPVFPQVSAEVVSQWLAQGEAQDDNSVIRSLHDWVRTGIKPSL